MKKQLLILSLVSVSMTQAESFKGNMREIGDQLLEAVTLPFVAIKNVIKDNDIDGDFMDVMGQFGSIPGEIKNGVKETAQEIADSKAGKKVASATKEAALAVKRAGQKVGDAFKDGAVAVKDASIKAGEKIKDAAQKTADVAKDAAKAVADSDAADVATQLFVDAPVQAGTAIKNVSVSAWDGFVDVVKDLKEAIVD